MKNETCTACGLCVAECPQGAIHIRNKKVTERVAVIDEMLCNHCGKCEKICPQNNHLSRLRTPKKCYAAWSKNRVIRCERSSAGAVSEICKNFAGEIIALSFNQNGRLIFRSFQSPYELTDMASSVYAFAEMDKTLYLHIKRELEHHPVLVVGLPCQIDGIRCFTGDHKNLYTINLICAGCPSKTILYNYLSKIGKYDKCCFRGRNNFRLLLYHGSKLIYQSSYSEDLYCKMFNQGMGYRECCYHCQYAQQNQIGDLTIGDFWGLGRLAPIPFNRTEGVNVVLVNSKKGERLLRAGKLCLTERPLSEAVKGNARLRECAKEPKASRLYKAIVPFLGVNASFKIAVSYNERRNAQ